MNSFPSDRASGAEPVAADAERVRFEKWARSESWVCDRNSFGDYVYETARDGWDAWQASQIGLPNRDTHVELIKMLNGLQDRVPPHYALRATLSALLARAYRESQA